MTPTVLFRKVLTVSGWMPGYRDKEGKLVKYVPILLSLERAQEVAREMAEKAKD